MVNVAFQSVLVIGARPDDVELGLGASLHRFATSDVQVRVVVLSSASLFTTVWLKGGGHFFASVGTRSRIWELVAKT